MPEEALLLGPQRGNVGVLTPACDAPGAAARLAVICLTAGLIHHVGPHRLHVLLARALARQGVATLRLDISGIGDSAARSDDLPAQQVPLREINDAMDELERRGYRHFVLFGICSGAVNALHAAKDNPRVAGVIVVNAGSDDGYKQVDPQLAAQFYLKQSLRNPRAWKNLFTGKVRYRLMFHSLLAALADRFRARDPQLASMEDSLRELLAPYHRQGTSILSVMSDRHAQYYQIHRRVYEKLQSPQFESLVYPKTDHLFTSLEYQRRLIEQVCRWVRELGQARQTTRPVAQASG